MPIFFEGPIGTTVMLLDPAVQGRAQLISLSDADISFDRYLSIITRFTFSQAVNAQFLHTLGNAIYIYTFGDRIGQVTISGLSFANDCNGNGISTSGAHGAVNMIQWYQTNRLSNRGSPVRILIGNYP